METREKYPAPLQLDVRAILLRRAPSLPAWVAAMLARLVRQKELNYLLRTAFPAAGHAFSKAVLSELDITLQVDGLENIPAGGHLVFASNHPLGGLDGIALIALLGERYGDSGIIFPVNDMLMNVRPLQEVFTPVNKYGRQGRDRADSLRRAFDSDRHVIIFPAGLVSRMGRDGIRDLEWRKTFLTLGAAAGRTIVPVHFQALNRRRFYRLASWRERLHIPFNLEQAMLPAELVNCRHRTFRISFLPPIDARHILEGNSPHKAAQMIKDMVYDHRATF